MTNQRKLIFTHALSALSGICFVTGAVMASWLNDDRFGKIGFWTFSGIQTCFMFWKFAQFANVDPPRPRSDYYLPVITFWAAGGAGSMAAVAALFAFYYAAVWLGIMPAEGSAGALPYHF